MSNRREGEERGVAGITAVVTPPRDCAVDKCSLLLPLCVVTGTALSEFESTNHRRVQWPHPWWLTAQAFQCSHAEYPKYSLASVYARCDVFAFL